MMMKFKQVNDTIQGCVQQKGLTILVSPSQRPALQDYTSFWLLLRAK